jgi:hypothetical protein
MKYWKPMHSRSTLSVLSCAALYVALDEGAEIEKLRPTG